MEDKKIRDENLPQERPIVDRPDEPPAEAMGDYDLEVWAYIEFLERELAGHRLLRQGYLDKLSDYSLETAKQSVEINRLTDAIREKDNAFEVCGDRRWEAEEKVGELMKEVDRLNTVIKNVR